MIGNTRHRPVMSPDLNLPAALHEYEIYIQEDNLAGSIRDFIILLGIHCDKNVRTFPDRCLPEQLPSSGTSSHTPMSLAGSALMFNGALDSFTLLGVSSSSVSSGGNGTNIRFLPRAPQPFST